MNDYSYHTVSSIINAFQKSVNFPFKFVCFFNYNLTPPDMYNELSQVYYMNQKEESISIQRVN